MQFCSISFISTFLLLLFLSNGAFAQVSIHDGSGTDPNASSMLDVQSTSAGVLVPRMTEAQRNTIASPATSLLIYQTNGTPGYYYNSGTPGSPVWERLALTSGTVSGTGEATRVAFWNTGNSLGSSANLYWDNGNGRLGIGTAAPSERLEVNGASRQKRVQVGHPDSNDMRWDIYYSNTGAPEWGLQFRDDSGNLRFWIGRHGSSQNMLLVPTSGNVGIGFNGNPGRRLEVRGDVRIDGGTGVASAGVLEIRQSGNTVNDGIALTSAHGTAHRIWKDAGGVFNIGTAGTPEMLSVTTGGNVGIGTVAPDATFHVRSSSTPGMILERTGSGAFHIQDWFNPSLPNNQQRVRWLMGSFGSMFGTPASVISLRKRDNTGGHINDILNIDLENDRIGLGYPTRVFNDFMVDGQSGLGTTAPTARLHVNGSVRFQSLTNGFLQADANGNLSIATGSGLFTSGNGLSWAGTTLNSVWTSNGNHIHNNNTGNVGVGITAPLDHLHVHSTVTNAFTTTMRLSGTGTAAGGGNAIFFKSSTNVTADRYGVKLGAIRSASNNGAAEFIIQMERAGLAGMEDVFRINNQGNVGIGFTNPLSILHVGSASDNVTDSQVARMESRGFAGLELIGDRDNVSGEPGGAYILLAQDGATLTGGPTSVKAMIGIAQGNNQDGAGGTYTGTTTNSVYFGHKHSSPLHLGTNGTVRMTILSNGNVGIGTANPTYNLHVNGRIRSNAINETSDARLKKNVTDLQDALAKVLAMRGVNYGWRTDEFPEMELDSTLQFGLIAQELEEVVPELVHTDEDGWKTIEYSHIVPLLIEAVKELELRTRQLENAEAQTRDMENRISSLEALLTDNHEEARQNRMSGSDLKRTH